MPAITGMARSYRWVSGIVGADSVRDGPQRMRIYRGQSPLLRKGILFAAAVPLYAPYGRCRVSWLPVGAGHARDQGHGPFL